MSRSLNRTYLEELGDEGDISTITQLMSFIHNNFRSTDENLAIEIGILKT